MSLPIYGMVSCYREGHLSYAAVESLLKCCREVFVLEGPVGDADAWADVVTPASEGKAGLESEFPKHRRVHVERGQGWVSDADKRTQLLKWVQRWRPGEAWGVVLDGDEVFLWSEFLPDYLARSEAEKIPGGVKIKLVFEDGQVYEQGSRCLRIDVVESYVLSGYQFKLRGVATPVIIPIIAAKQAPLQGEPHVLHRGYLRPPDRNQAGLRMSRHELDALAELGIGQASPDGPIRISPGRKVIIPGVDR